MRSLAALPLLVIALSGCREKTKSSASEPAPKSSAASSDGRTVRCSDVLLAGDIQATCGVAVTLATPPSDLDDIGPERTCSRRFTAKSQSLSFMITLLDDAATARNVYDATTDGMAGLQPIAGLGDAARRYTRTRSGDDTVFNVELIKGKLNVLLFTAKVPFGGKVIDPVCTVDQLDKLGRTLAARL